MCEKARVQVDMCVYRKYLLFQAKLITQHSLHDAKKPVEAVGGKEVFSIHYNVDIHITLHL